MGIPAVVTPTPNPNPAYDIWTSSTAPWWSSLVGILVGALITAALSIFLARGNRKHELRRIAAETTQQQRASWRTDVLTQVLRMIELSETIEVEIKRRATEFNTAFPGEKGWMVNDVVIKDGAVTMDDANEEAIAPMRDEMRHCQLRLQILRSGDIAAAGDHLLHLCRPVYYLRPMAAAWVRATRISRARYYLRTMAEMHLSPFVQEPTGSYEKFVDDYEREHPMRMQGMTPNSEVDVSLYWES